MRLTETRIRQIVRGILNESGTADMNMTNKLYKATGVLYKRAVQKVLDPLPQQIRDLAEQVREREEMEAELMTREYREILLSHAREVLADDIRPLNEFFLRLMRSVTGDASISDDDTGASERSMQDELLNSIASTARMIILNPGITNRASFGPESEFYVNRVISGVLSIKAAREMKREKESMT